MTRWLEARIGGSAALAGLRVRDAGWATALRAALVGVLVVQAVSGLSLMTVYAPATQTAWASVRYVTAELPGGWLLRGLHHFASHALVVLLAVDVVVAVARRAYAPPREVAWWLLLARVGLGLGLAVTGHLLPWDQPGWWARRVELGITERVPVVGAALRAMLQGGATLGQLTLTRAHAMHTAALPIALTLVTLLHIALDRRARHAPDPSGPWWPTQAARDAAATALVVAVAVALAVRAHGAPLGAPADPASDYPARPEWFLLPMFLLRKLGSGPLETLATGLPPLLLAAWLFALPWIDRRAVSGVTVSRLAVSPLVAALAFAGVAVVVVPRADAGDPSFARAVTRADARARLAFELARDGVPPSGPLDMLRAHPAARGEDLFARHCASCHVLGDLGDPKKSTAPALDRWGTEAWVLDLLHDPDADSLFGRSPYAGMMPSVDLPPKDRKPDDPPFKPMPDDEKRAVAAFLAGRPDSRGETIVRERCTTCHLYRGEGDDASQDHAPELSGWGTAAWARAQIANPATPTTYRSKALDESLKKHMPRFDTELSPVDLNLVARFVHARARGLDLR